MVSCILIEFRCYRPNNRYSYGYSTHPGSHVAVATTLIDAVLLRMCRRWNIMNIGSVVVLNVITGGVSNKSDVDMNAILPPRSSK